MGLKTSFNEPVGLFIWFARMETEFPAMFFLTIYGVMCSGSEGLFLSASLAANDRKLEYSPYLFTSSYEVLLSSKGLS